MREVDPGGAASIIETDCNVDFDEPVGYDKSKYAEYERQAAEKKRKVENGVDDTGKKSESEGEKKVERALQKAEFREEHEEKPSFVPFAGTARRIDGKSATASNSGNGASNNNHKDDNNDDSKPKYYTAPARKSMVGKKYSKTGSTMSAFGGKGNALK